MKVLKTSLVLFVLLSHFTEAGAGELRYSMAHRLQYELLHEIALRSQLWENGAMRYYKDIYPGTEISISGEYFDEDDAHIAQLGSNSMEYEIYAGSVMALKDKSHVITEAAYSRARSNDVLWNYQSDVVELFPYLVGDSIGGHLDRERYRFTLAYATRLGEWVLSPRLRYRAEILWRDKDPRPRNVVSDFDVSLGASRDLGGNILGLSLGMRTYSQKCEISYLADKGSTSVYHLLGLGMDYVRFAGGQTSSLYSIWGLNGSVDYISNNGLLSISLSGSHNRMTKRLTSVNNIPINELSRTDVSLTGSWLKTGSNLKYGVKLDAEAELRNGIENIFGDPSGNSYPQISSVSQYKFKCLDASCVGMIGSSRQVSVQWNVLPSIRYSASRMEYLGNGRFVDVNTLKYGVEFSASKMLNNTLLSVRSEVNYEQNAGCGNNANTLDSTRSVNATLLSNIAVMCDDRFSYGIGVESDFIIKDKSAVSVSASWRHVLYESLGNNRYINFSIKYKF